MSASSGSDHPSHDLPHDLPHNHRDHDHDHSHEHSELGEMDLRVRALETLLADKGYIEPSALDALIDTYQTRVGPRNGARVVARAKGYRRIVLWTNSVLLAARAIYARNGYVLTKSEPHRSFGHELVGETWELKLS